MYTVIRKLVAIGLSVALPVGALCAPLVHAHRSDHDSSHHAADVIHAHVSGHAAAPTVAHSLSLDEPEGERAVYLQLFVAVPAASFDVPLAVATSVEPGAPAEAPARHSLHVVHGHDPPFIRFLTARAPPAFMS